MLKIGADAFPKLRILATGSSILAATRNFRDSLAGRKREVNLQPVLCEEPAAFGATRPMVMSWIEAMRITHVIRLIRSFHGNGDSDLVKQPRIDGVEVRIVSPEA